MTWITVGSGLVFLAGLWWIRHAGRKHRESEQAREAQNRLDEVCPWQG
jgi:cbb3-type cytochrome oxidase subunit 3